MQRLAVAAPQKAGKLVPRPAPLLGHRSHDFGCAGLDSAAVRRRQEALVDVRIPKGDAKITALHEISLEDFFETARLFQADQHITAILGGFRNAAIAARGYHGSSVP